MLVLQCRGPRRTRVGMDKGMGLRHRHTQDHQESWFNSWFPRPCLEVQHQYGGLGLGSTFFFFKRWIAGLKRVIPANKQTKQVEQSPEEESQGLEDFAAGCAS